MRGIVCHTGHCSYIHRQLCNRSHRSLSISQRQFSASRSNMQPCARAACSNLQRLYEVAHSTFTSNQQPKHVPDLRAVTRALRDVSLQELGLQSTRVSEHKKQTGWFGNWSGSSTNSREPTLTYTHIHEDSTMSIGIFCLEQGAMIPFHNHPGMVVLSRVLYGDLHVKSYDWTDGGAGTQSATAQLVLDQVIDASSGPAAIFPASGGNIHQFTAVTDCAVLDVLAPPYSPEGGRDCTYYHVEETDKPGLVHLHVRRPAPYLNMKNLRYKGIPIQPMSTALR